VGLAGDHRAARGTAFAGVSPWRDGLAQIGVKEAAKAPMVAD